MKTIVYVLTSAILMLSAVCDEPYYEDYADVNCQYQWGGFVCDCEHLKHVITNSIC